jgi:NhaP-type Na+/H+ or K+/H+ antiporter
VLSFSFDVHTAAMTVAVALLAGMVGQSLAYHLRLPGIVILLLFGVLLGPDCFHIIDPRWLEPGYGLDGIIGFAIAIILFEAGMNLEWGQLRSEAPAIRRLVTLGAVITWVGATLAAKWIMGWDMRLSMLFGSLVIATGPTVVSPLLRRIRVRRNLQIILEAEGVFIESIGAIIAVLSFGFMSADVPGGIGVPGGHVLTRLAIGALVGTAGGGLLMLLLRSRRVIPVGMEKVFALTLAWGIYQVSNALARDSGILAVVVAAVMAANVAKETMRGVRESKEPLTVMLVGVLLVLFAAEVRMSDVTALGVRGIAVVVVLMFAVRPLCVLACTTHSGLSGREKMFLSWIAPRGIMAAALAAVFYYSMRNLGIEGRESMRGLVFLVIMCTVFVQGLSGSMAAGWFGVRRPRGQGYVILGGNPLAVELARVLKSGGEESVLIDANPSLCNEVEAKGFRVLHGNALDERIMERAEIETRKAVISLLPNDGVNLLFARRAVDDYRADRVYVALHGGAIKPAHISEIRGRVLFGSAAEVDQWASRLGRGEALVEQWNFAGVPDPKANPTMPVAKEARTNVLPLAIARGATVRPIDDRYEPKKGDVATWLIFSRRDDDARAWLRARGWVKDGVSS